MIGRHSEPPQVTGVGTPHDRHELCVPSHIFRLILKPTGTRDGVEAQRVLLYKRPFFETSFVDVDDRLHFVFHCCEEEGFQIANIADNRMWHGVDGLENIFPRLRGLLNVNVRESTGSPGRGLGNGEHGFEDWGYER